MRLSLIALALLTAACAQQGPRELPVANGPVACTAQGTLNEGLAVRAFPATCPDEARLIDGYNTGRRIADLEREVAELDLLRKGQFYKPFPGSFHYGFGSSGYYTSLWFQRKNELKVLRERVGLTA